MKYLGSFFVLLGSLSCSHYGSINLKKHEFAKQPNRIIWLHFSGLNEEHISLLKFFHKNTMRKTSFESASCFGKMWGYNLYQLRPKHHSGFLSQALGTQNIKQTCQDYDARPIWSYLADYGYQSGILEKTSYPKYSLAQASVCKKDDFLKETVLWRMQRGDSDLFHAQEEVKFNAGKIYYDKSCHRDGCYNSLLTNIRAIMEGHFKRESRFIFTIKDDGLYQYLTQKNMNEVKNYLLEIERVFEYFIAQQKNDPKMLVLMTTSESLPVEMPRRGRGWKEIARGKDNLIYRRNSLLSPVWALGVRAENFCGLYEEAEILHRTLNNSTKKKLYLFGIPIM